MRGKVKKTVERFRRRPIGLRPVMLLAVGLVLVPALIALVTLQTSSYRTQRAGAYRANHDAAQAVATMFSNYVQNTVRHAYAIGAGLVSLQPFTPEAVQTFLRRNTRLYPDVDAFFWTDPDGTIVLGSHEEGGGVSVADRAYFKQIAQGHDWSISGVLIGRVAHEPTIVVARAVRGRDSQLLGVVLATINVARLVEMVEDNQRMPGDCVRLYDFSGRRVELEMQAPSTTLGQVKHDDLLAQALGGKAVAGTFTSPVDGKIHWGAFVPVNDTGYVAGVSRPRARVMAPLYRQFALGLGWIALLAALSLAMATLVHRWIVASVEALRRHANTLSRGNFDYRAREHGIREFQELADAFNHMSENLRESQESLRQSEERFRTLTEAMPQMVWTTTAEGEPDYYNTWAAEYCGLPPERLVGGEWKGIIHPDALGATLEKWRAAFEEGQPFENEYRLRRTDGVFRWHLTRAMPVRDMQGRIVKWFGTSTDIDDMRRAREELARSNRDLEQFAFMVSHDLQQPLVVIGGYLNLLQREAGDQLPPEARGHVAVALEAAGHMQEMVRGMLDYARIESRGKPFVETDIGHLIKQVVTVLEKPLQESGAELVCDPLPTLSCDQAQIAQLFQNLLSNAIKFRHPQRTPRIRIVAREEERHWLLGVEDNGIGIPVEEQGRLFQVFHRVHKQEEYPGAGIGLAICKRIVERHGGDIWAESVPGEGTAFRFTLRKSPPAP